MFSCLLCCSAFANVNTDTFRTCKDLRFCRENIKSKLNWKLDPSSVQFTDNLFQANLLLNGKPADLRLKLYGLQTGGYRFRVDPISAESFTRFDLADYPPVINQDSIQTRTPIQTTRADSEFTLKDGPLSISLKFSPLVITVSLNSKRIAVINSEQQLLFEHGSPTELKEPFHSFTDIIPHGATAVGCDFTFLGDTVHLTGLGERASPANLADTESPIRLFNSDAVDYESDNPIHLYASVPYVVAHSQAFTASLFWINPSDTFASISTADDGRQLRFVSETGFLDFVLFVGAPQELSTQYSKLTGFPAMPPVFAFGYHQSRWGYATQHEVGVVIRGLDDASMPFDSLWLDLDHLIQKSPFTFSKQAFPNAEQLIMDLLNEDRYLVKLCDPHLPHNSEHRQYKDVRKNKFAVQVSNGTPFVGDAWPGQCVFPDFLNPAVSAWWAQQVQADAEGQGANIFYWNDMNEPSIFKNEESTFPKALVHYNGTENREIHNLYGLLNAAATFAGLSNLGNTRPFVLTRSYFAGAQRYAWTWTGDNTASWDHLAVSVQMVLTSGITGMPFTGADVGGFLKSPDAPLLIRWFQTASWTYPFFREHCHHKSGRREPFMFEGDEKEALRTAIRDRYHMLPLWYTAAHLANRTGIPLVTPVWYEFPEADTHEADSGVIVAGSLFVVPVVEDEPEEIEVTKPPGKWYRYPSGKELKKESQTFPVTIADTFVFVRGGRIVPTFASIGKSAIQTLPQPVVLYIAPDENGAAEGELYLDDGVSYGFSKGEFIWKKFSYANGKLTSTAVEGGTTPASLKDVTIAKVVLFSDTVKTVDVNRKLSDNIEIRV
jgi:alpha 1,3-glucosidase